MKNLLRCPFCGKEVAEITNVRECEECANFEQEDLCPEFEQPGSCIFLVVCNANRGGCGCGSGYYKTADEAVEAWNRRA